MKLSCLIALTALAASASTQVAQAQRLGGVPAPAPRLLQNGNSGNNPGNGGSGNPGNAGGGGGNPGNGGVGGDGGEGGGCPETTPTCETGNGEGISICRMRNANRNMTMQQCIDPSQTKKISKFLAKGSSCGCCDFENPVLDGKANTGTCPTGTCDDEEPCTMGDGGEGVYMCRRKGGSGKSFTQCVNTTKVSLFQAKGATCGCCGDSGCPTGKCSEAEAGVSESCTKGDDTADSNSYYMCRSINPKRNRYKTMCVDDELTLDRQFKWGAQCGCCKVVDGELTVSAENCPQICDAVNSQECSKTDDDTGETETEAGFLMCMKQGNRKRTMCVTDEDQMVQKQSQGMAECGCCKETEDEECPATECEVEFDCNTDDDTDGSFMCMTLGNSERTKVTCVDKADVQNQVLQGRRTCGCCGDTCPSEDEEEEPGRH